MQFYVLVISLNLDCDRQKVWVIWKVLLFDSTHWLRTHGSTITFGGLAASIDFEYFEYEFFVFALAIWTNCYNHNMRRMAVVTGYRNLRFSRWVVAVYIDHLMKFLSN